MRLFVLGSRTSILLAVLGLSFGGLSAEKAFGQFGSSGVVIDARGTVHQQVFPDPTGQLTRQRAVAAKASLDADVAKFSKLRMISLNRLEKAIADNNGTVTDEMRYLAGLLRVQYVFYYPETKDIVLAGPSEGWMTDLSGRVVGLTSGRPIVQLQDLVVALRAFPPEGKTARTIGCSIDPTQEGLANMQRFLRSTGSYATPDQTQQIVAGLRNSLGLQTISIQGIPADTHFAQVMVEADYRMKLIGIGLERPPIRMVSFIDRASPSHVSRNALFRWYFVPDYECVRRSEDGLAMELVGDGVKLIGEDELVSMQGGRNATVRSNSASQAFVTSFTQKYSELAERSPVYAELRNLIDLAVTAAYLREEGLYDKSGWKMTLFSDEDTFSVQTLSAPKTVGSAVAAVWKGRRLMTPIGGGVQINAMMALAPEKILKDEKEKVAELHAEIELDLNEGQWWWE